MIVHAHIIHSIQSLVPFLIIVNIPFTNVNISDLPSPTLCVHNTYEDQRVFENGTYRLCELDGTMLLVPIAGKHVKIFKKRTDEEPYVILDKTDNEEQSDEDRDDAGSENGLQLIVDIRGESESASDEDG